MACGAQKQSLEMQSSHAVRREKTFNFYDTVYQCKARNNIPVRKPPK